jgi:hypothetical protein
MSRFPDELERRCPRLGGPVRFAYCRTDAAEGGLCPKILDCWWERFDVASLMREALSEEDFARLSRLHPPPNKVASLIDLIRQARERTDKDA